MLQDIGKLIRQKRGVKKISLSALARQINVSKSLICQIEKGEVLPSLLTLEKISGALDVPIAGFFELDEADREKTHNIIVRKEKRPAVIYPGANTVYYILTPTLTRQTEFIIVDFPPFSENIIMDEYKHEGDEYFLVLEGEFTFLCDNETYTLYEGDSGCFDSSKRHSYTNNTGKQGKILIVATYK